MKTVAYIDDRAVGVAALLPLACRDIVFKKSARMGDVRQIITGRNNQLAGPERGPGPGPDQEGRVPGRQEGPSRGRRPGHGRSRRRGRRGQRPPDRRRAALAPRGGRGRPGTLPGRRRSARTPGLSLDRHRRRGRLLRPGPGREQRGGAQGALRPARQARSGSTGPAGSIRWSRS